ncbi:MAG: hypothetical protein KIT72_11700 [Polyangiaceae bacterium]|nr:hypothetical protein [Polyangiaceae bacterium]MCW5791077.1 hypothetical protein [Polyangiaceae bacterium]
MQRYQNHLVIGWAPCDLAESRKSLPEPCFAAHCYERLVEGSPAQIQSTCNEQKTREMWRCGGRTSAWDEDCCLRPACTKSGACPDGMECRSEAPRAGQLCGQTETGCSCSGNAGDVASPFCFPKDE